METAMNYAEARSQIKTGDLVGVRDVHNVLGTLTQDLTHSPYTHTGVAVWLGERLFMADLNSGRNALHAVSQLDNFDVCDPPPGLERPKIEAAIFDWLAKSINYGMAAFVLIGLKCALKLKVFIHWRKIIVCSGGSVEIYENAGWGEHSRMISPGELVAELGLPKIQVRKQDQSASTSASVS
jgi:hypothetical protein